ncbi:hypothetical protein GQR58_029801 [Nymphon striatum]|nr:hypothetical protein GQR58_029801 [Nymphon striatum]
MSERRLVRGRHPQVKRARIDMCTEPSGSGSWRAPPDAIRVDRVAVRVKPLLTVRRMRPHGVQEALYCGHLGTLAGRHLRGRPVDRIDLRLGPDAAKEVVTRAPVVFEEVVRLHVLHDVSVPLQRLRVIEVTAYHQAAAGPKLPIDRCTNHVSKRELPGPEGPGSSSMQLSAAEAARHLSGAGPFRRTLFGERSRTLFGIVRTKHTHERVLNIPELGLGLVGCRPNELLRSSNSQRCVDRYGVGKFEGNIDCLALCRHPGNHAGFFCFLGQDWIAGDGHFHGSTETNAAWQALQATAGCEQTDLDLADAQLGALRSNQQVTRHGELKTAGKGESLDSTDQWLLRTIADEVHQRADVLTRSKGLEVHASAETATVAGEHTTGVRRVRVELLDGFDQTSRQGTIDRVHRIGAIQRDQQYSATSLGQDGGFSRGVAHFGGIRMPPSTRMVFSIHVRVRDEFHNHGGEFVAVSEAWREQDRLTEVSLELVALFTGAVDRRVDKTRSNGVHTDASSSQVTSDRQGHANHAAL